MKWITYDLPKRWGAAPKFTVTLEVGKPGTVPSVLSQLVKEWEQASHGAINVASGLEVAPSGLILHASCKQSSGHWLATLWVLLSDARWKTGVRKAAVTIEES